MYSVFVLSILLLLGPSCSNSDNLALLLDTLKTIQRPVCDEDVVFIECPKKTAISIIVAQYGTADAEDSPCSATTNKEKHEIAKNCKTPNSVQYSLLQRVVEACQKKPQCKFSTKPKPDFQDTCPFAKMYVDVSYKCRPHEFRSRTVCENEVVKLSCNAYSRIAIFDAQYGRTAYETTCSPKTGLADESCSTPYVVEKVMQMCLGKRRCQIVASSRTFESFCSPQTRPYLKVIYACVTGRLHGYRDTPGQEKLKEVPLGIINERYESAAEADELIKGTTVISDDLFDESEEAGEKWGETSAGSPIADSALQPPLKNVTPPLNSVEDTTIFTSETNIERSEDLPSSSKLYLFIGIVVIIFVILIAIFVGVRCYLDHKAKTNSKTGDMFTTETPNVFNDAISDIDNDVDVSHISGTFYDPMHPDMILYKDLPGSRGTIRAMKPLSTIYPIAGASMYGNVDYVPSQSRDIPTRFTRSRSKEDQANDMMMSPKSLATYSNSQYYYG